MDCSPPGSSVHGILPVKNTGVGCHFLLQGIFPTQGSDLSLLCLLHWQVDSLPLHHLGSPLLDQGMGNPQLQMADCIYCTTHSYIRILSIQGFWCLRGSWNQFPADTEGQLHKTRSKSSSHLRFPISSYPHRWTILPIPCISSKGYFYISTTHMCLSVECATITVIYHFLNTTRCVGEFPYQHI